MRQPDRIARKRGSVAENVAGESRTHVDDRGNVQTVLHGFEPGDGQRRTVGGKDVGPIFRRLEIEDGWEIARLKLIDDANK